MDVAGEGFVAMEHVEFHQYYEDIADSRGEKMQRGNRGRFRSQRPGFPPEVLKRRQNFLVVEFDRPQFLHYDGDARQSPAGDAAAVRLLKRVVASQSVVQDTTID